MRGAAALVIALGLTLAQLSCAKLYSISPAPQIPASELPLASSAAPPSEPTAANGEQAVMDAVSAEIRKVPVSIAHLAKKSPVSIKHIKSPVSIEHVEKKHSPLSISPINPNALAPAAVGESAAASPPVSEGCPFSKDEMTDMVGAEYYHEGPASDNSFGCWTTDFLWAFLLYVGGMWLKSQSRDQNGLTLLWRPGYEHTRWMLCWGTLSLCMAEVFAGWYHLVFTNLKIHKEDTVWALCLFCLANSASLYTSACIAMHKEGDSTWTNMIGYTVSFSSGYVMFALAFILDWDFPLAFSIMSLAPLVAVTFSVGLHGIKYKTYKDTIPILVGCIISLLALATQWSNSEDCAVPCPVNCPFPVPNINHNAVYHLIAMLAVYPTMIGMAGICHELEAPDGMPYFGLYARERHLKTNYKRPHARRDQIEGRFAQDPDSQGNYRDDCLPNILPVDPSQVAKHIQRSMHGPEEAKEYQHDYVHRHDHGPGYNQ